VGCNSPTPMRHRYQDTYGAGAPVGCAVTCSVPLPREYGVIVEVAPAGIFVPTAIRVDVSVWGGVAEGGRVVLAGVAAKVEVGIMAGVDLDTSVGSGVSVGCEAMVGGGVLDGIDVG
jgi:hypothetical protein